jgi:hypothetical protein
MMMMEHGEHKLKVLDAWGLEGTTKTAKNLPISKKIFSLEPYI